MCRITSLISGAACALVLVFSGPCRAQTYEKLPDWAQAWVNEACSGQVDASMRRSCIERNVAAIIRPGFPDLSSLSAPNRDWVGKTCAVHREFVDWRLCVEKNIAALERPWPDLSSLAFTDSAWISRTCDGLNGPSRIRTCIEENLAALRRPGMPNLTNLSYQDQIVIYKECSFNLGPARWRSCVERYIAALNPKYEAPRSVTQQRKQEPAPSDSPAKQASPDPNVYRAQRYLQVLGYGPGPIDGVFGPRTRGAIQSFQKDHGLQSDGMISLPLLSALEIASQEKSREREKPKPQTRESQNVAVPQGRWPSWRPVTSKRPAARPISLLSPSEVYETAKGSVWVIVAGRQKLDFEKLRELSQGSAIAVSRKHLLTNCHVVEERPVIAIVQGKEIERATLISADPSTDRCILMADKRNLIPVRGIRSFETLKVGERVYSVGAPSGLERTLGEGIISGLRPTSKRHLIQTTAPISPGSSGGGLFDNSGNLIGVTTFLLKEAQSINFAIAADDYWH